MATQTPNIGLTKPIGTEKYDLAVVNANSDIIDTQITDAKAGSNLRVFKVKNDLTNQDNAVSRVAGDSRYLQINLSITAFISLTYSHTTDAVSRFNQTGAGKISSFLVNGIEKSYVDNNGDFWANGKKLINTDATAPTAQMIDFAGDTPPAGYLVCNGGVVLQSSYPELYAVLGVLWANTAGASTPLAGEFRIPPQEFGGLGLYSRGVGGINGAVGTYQTDVFKSHSHNYYKHTGDGGGSGPSLNQHPALFATTTTGDTRETRPRTLTVLKCIKY